MQTSRREFLNRTVVTAAVFSLGSRFPLMDSVLEKDQASATHGLLFDADDLPRMRQTIQHPRFAGYWKTLSQADLDADRKFLKEDLKLNNHVKDLLQARLILERSSFVYALTGDTKQLALAQLAIERLLQYKKWDYFLEGGEHTIGLQRAPETTIAMAFALEWLDEVLGNDMKREMETQIAEKGAPACYRTLYGMMHPDRVRGWGFDPESDYPLRFDLSRWPIILNSTNLKVIPIAGLGIAGCILHGRHPQAETWVDMARRSAKAFAPIFGSDGSYEEGASYWGYTALHLTMFLEVLYRKLGIDERGLINYPGTVRYALQMSMPTAGKPGDCVNFSDASVVGDTSVAAWVARRYRDSIAQYVTTAVGEVKNHYGIIWFDPSLEPGWPDPGLLDVRFANDWVVSRSGWDERSTVVALRSGPPANHEHADRNSVIVKAYDERLLHDPFKAAYSYTQQHWRLRLTESHTAILINGKGHQYHDGHEGTNASWAKAEVLSYKTSPGSMVVTSDATEAYQLVNPDVRLVRRTVIFLKPDIVLLYDRVRLQSAKARVQLRYQVYNEDGNGNVKLEQAAFLVQRPRASLRGSVQSSVPFIVRSGLLNVPKEIGVYPYVETETEESLDHNILTLCTVQEAGKDHGAVSWTTRDQSWVAKLVHNGLTKTITISVDEDLPVVDIL